MLHLHGLAPGGAFPELPPVGQRTGSIREDRAARHRVHARPARTAHRLQRGGTRFFLHAPGRAIPQRADFSEGELVALFVARRALEQYRGTPYEKPLRSAFEKLTAALPEQIGFDWEEFDRAVAFHPGTRGSGVADLQIFQTVSDAVLRGEEVEFDYKKPSARASAPPERRRVQGLHLGCFDNQWYLIGQDLVRGATRTFVLGRMTRVRNTRKRFARPSGFSLDALLAGSFGVFSGLKTRTAAAVVRRGRGPVGARTALARDATAGRITRRPPGTDARRGRVARGRTLAAGLGTRARGDTRTGGVASDDGWGIALRTARRHGA